MSLKAFAAVLAMAVALPCALGAQERRPLTALDLYRLKQASGVALSPDGRRVAFVVTEVDSAQNRYRRDLWIANSDGTGLRRLTWLGLSVVSDPAFSPDGRQLAFVQARQGGQRQIWILPLAEGGEAWPLTDLRTGAFAPSWSPDSRRIAFLSAFSLDQLAEADTSRRRVNTDAIAGIHRDRDAALAAIRAKLENNARSRDPRVVTRLAYLGETDVQEESYPQIHVVEVRPGASPLRITRDRYAIRPPRWTPAGDSLIYSASPPTGDHHPDHERESDLHIVAADGSGVPRVIAEPGSGELNAEFSQDGRHIVYLRAPVDTAHPTATNNELVVMRRDGSDRRSITATMDRQPGGFVVTRDGWIYFTVFTDGSVPLYRTRIDRIDPQPVVRGARGVLGFDVAGDRVAWVQMSPSHPSDVYVSDRLGAGEGRVTALNDSLLSTVFVSDYHELRYPSFDGQQVQAWYLLPINHQPGSRPPLAVEIHGGPHVMWGPGEASMWLEYQMLAGAGYTVFLSNPRGSQGYGTAGLRSIHRDWGTPAARDILAGADSLIARGLADAARQAITGGSYAGYMTAWIIAREAPERFRAAVAQRGVYDLGIWYYGSNTWRLFEGEFGTRPWEDPEIVRAQSPLTYVADIRTPLLLLHGEADYRTTIVGADALYRAMTVLGKDVEFVRYPREGHELTRSGEPAHRIDHMLRILEFFERHIRH